MNWANFKNKISQIDVSSAIGSLKESTNSAVGFVKTLSSNEPRQFIEAEQLGIYYITQNVMAMGYPSQDSIFSGTSIENMSAKNPTMNKLTKLVSDSLANKIAKYLNKYHAEHYMIWNLSEKSYPTQLFNDQVIEFKFPGYPSPPLVQLFELLSSIDNWLSSNNRNVAIIHCQTGKGRTVTVISAYLAWSKYQNFSPAKALLHSCKVMNGTIKNMTIPSQTRYLAYLTKILQNKQIPKSNPIKIQRVIIHKIPIFEINQETHYIKKKKKIDEQNKDKDKNKENENNAPQKTTRSPSILDEAPTHFMIGDDDDEDDENEQDEELGSNIIEQIEREKDAQNDKNEQKNEDIDNEEKEMKIIKKCGVRPYIQIFKNAKLIFSSRRKSQQNGVNDLKFYDESDEHIKFEINREIEGDVLVRIRHLCGDGKSKISVCRFAFNTGYLESFGVIRFKKTQLDGAWNSNKFHKDFWIDLLIGKSNENENENENNKGNDHEPFWDNVLIQREDILLKKQSDNEWKKLLTEWNLSQYIDDFIEHKVTDQNEWINFKKSDLVRIGLSEVDAQIFLNMNDNADNVANDDKNNIDLVEKQMEIKEENEQSILEEMDVSDKEMMKSMNDLMTMSNDDNESKKEDENDQNTEINAQNAEEAEVESNDKTTTDTFGDLEQFADGLDLDNVEVDSDTEQNFEMLLEELNDETVHQKDDQNDDANDLP